MLGREGAPQDRVNIESKEALTVGYNEAGQKIKDGSM